MNAKSILLTCLGLGVLMAPLGCDAPPDPLTTESGQEVKVLSVDPEDGEELQAVKEAEAARVAYRYRLEVLEAFYRDRADLTKLNWARAEMKNLNQAQWFDWEGVEAVPPAGESIANADEHALVEQTVAARQAWVSAIQRLEALYRREQNTEKLQAIELVQQRYDPVRVYMYFLDAEIPGPNLRPTAVIPEAAALYAEAMDLYNKGKGWTHTFVSTDYQLQRQALLKLLTLVRTYPTSTKIGQAAYFIGEIYKEYFNQNYRAVHWYQRAWQWDSGLDQPARFQAAVVYDLRLQDKVKALELYQESIKYDPWRLGNYEYATDRIEAISKELSTPPQVPQPEQE